MNWELCKRKRSYVIQPTASEFSRKNCKISVHILIMKGDVKVRIFNSEFAEHEGVCYTPLYSRAFHQCNYRKTMSRAIISSPL
jgi:hypothetical protein